MKFLRPAFCFQPLGSLLLLSLLLATQGCRPPMQRAAEDPFSKHVRTTEARTPAQEQAGFRLPPGFEIQLFAAEPQIGKPMNMAFDARGRMWLTQSYEYPFADTSGAGRDCITILEDTDGDGAADTFTRFADSLNIPIGIVAVQDGAIAYSIPHIYHFIDRNGDDKVDERKILYTGFGYDDTHGMVNNFIRGWDGWIHADHGFSNTSKVAGTDGDTLTLVSGNTFRFRADGSHLEFTTTGRVNPFGYAYDELGYTYSVDCHTSPIYQLIRGADYPHFGKKPTGIGFGPALMQHEHGATALAGLEYYLAPHFPPAFQQCFYLGDVVKSRVYRASMKMEGTTPAVHWEEDFVVSDDPWFRPVDVKMGPDGALYIADFYNRIIGHYEVPLEHPGRDRRRGRIWRIVYTGREAAPPPRPTDWSAASLPQLLAALNHPNLPLRMSIADQIVDRFGQQGVQPLLEMMEKAGDKARIQGMWILYRLNALPQPLLAAAVQDQDDTVAVHALRIMFESETLSDSLQQIALQALSSASPHVQRQAAMVLARHPRLESVPPLLRLRMEVDEHTDSHFFYVLRQSLRDHLRHAQLRQWVLQQEWEPAQAHAWADLMRGVDHPQAARYLLGYLQQHQPPTDMRTDFLTHAARYLPAAEQQQLIRWAKQEAGEDLDEALALFSAISSGVEQAGEEMQEAGKKWGLELAAAFLELPPEGEQWTVVPNEHLPYSANPWRLVDTSLGAEAAKLRLLVSGPLEGGWEVSTLHSPAFELPEKLELTLIGHKQQPEDPEQASPAVNRVELRLLQNDSLLAVEYVEAPHSLKRLQWQLEAWAGQQARLLVVDASTERGEYVGVGGFEPEVCALPALSPHTRARRQLFACQLVRNYRAGTLAPALAQLLENRQADVYARAAAAEALLELNGTQVLGHIEAVLADEATSPLLKDKLALCLSEMPQKAAWKLLGQHLSSLSYQTQQQIAQNLSSSEAGIALLLEAAANARIQPRLLLQRKLSESLLSGMNAAQRQQYQALTASLQSSAADIDKIITARLQGFADARPNIEKGRQVFTRHCAPCHSIRGQGGNIGPQLDGIGNWGRRALTEKMLDPNRNISKAFVTYTLKLKDGKTSSGLFRREEGELLVFANMAGQEFSIPKAEIVEQTPSPYTLMPDNFAATIPEADFYELLGFLLQQF